MPWTLMMITLFWKNISVSCYILQSSLYASWSEVFDFQSPFCYIWSHLNAFCNIVKMAIHSITLAWKIPWTEEPGRLQPWGCEESDTTSDFTFTFHFHALEKEMATHSNVLAWRIPGTREPPGCRWAVVFGVAQSWTRLKRLSSSSIIS